MDGKTWTPGALELPLVELGPARLASRTTSGRWKVSLACWRRRKELPMTPTRLAKPLVASGRHKCRQIVRSLNTNNTDMGLIRQMGADQLPPFFG